jgi:two-component system, OmpR family, sensor kinase
VNLLNNAFGHNPPGTRVEVTAVAEAAELSISVLDDGLGMPPELTAAPFEPARRPRRPATTPATRSNGGRKRAGAGLGLSIARGIVHAHGGRLELTTRPQGTCFRVYLPVEAEVLETAGTPRPADGQASSHDTTERGTGE